MIAALVVGVVVLFLVAAVLAATLRRVERELAYARACCCSIDWDYRCPTHGDEE